MLLLVVLYIELFCFILLKQEIKEYCKRSFKLFSYFYCDDKFTTDISLASIILFDFQSSIADDHHILEQENTFQQASNQQNTLRTALNHHHYYGRRAPRGHNRGNSNRRYGDRFKQSDSVPR